MIRRPWYHPRVSRLLLGAMLLAVLLGAAPAAVAQPPRSDDDRERAFVEGLRRGDPAAAERYVALRDAREQARAELKQAEARYGAAGQELRPVFLPQVRQARRKYAESSLALLDFLDARDRQAIASYRETIDRITRMLEEHARTRAELEKLLKAE
jgi:hypothetical protein